VATRHSFTLSSMCRKELRTYAWTKKAFLNKFAARTKKAMNGDHLKKMI